MGDQNGLNRDQVAGRTDQAAGEIKETVGEATGDRGLEREGLGEQVAGKTQEREGDTKQAVDEIASGDTKALRDAVKNG